MRGFLKQAALGLGITAIATPAVTSAEENPPSSRILVDTIVVSARPIESEAFDILQGTTLLGEDQLQERMAGTLGETLSGLPGLRTSFFGPGASRPVIRGLSGPRVRTLIEGIGTIDVASSSPDHAVASNPLGAERIEVIRGPATLMWGNSAVGGVVNVLDRRIPSTRPEKIVSGHVAGLYGTNAEEALLSAHVDAALGPLVLHLSGDYRDAGNYDSPLAHDGYVPNSDVKTKSGTVGLSWVGEKAHFGVSYSRYDTLYGIPFEEDEDDHGHEDDHDHEDEHGHEDEQGHEDEHGHAHENVDIDLVQDRFDLSGRVEGDLLLFEAAKIRFGYADYEHVELEDGEVGTQFLNEGWEGRLELSHKPAFDGALEGASGIQLRSRDLEAIGEEAFVPPNETDSWGVFTFHKWSQGIFSAEAGLRVEEVDVQTPTMKRSFSLFGAAGGVSVRPADGWLLGVHISRSERGPSAEELFSNGPHLATNGFEIGNPDLREETATNLEATVRYRNGWLNLSANGFVTWYDDFIVLSDTSGMEDGLPIRVYSATQARFTGFEIDADFTVLEESEFRLSFGLGADYVKATDTTNDVPLPRIPSFGLTGEARVEWRWLEAALEVHYSDTQNRTAPLETPTDDYVFLNALVIIEPFEENPDLRFAISARNLTNSKARAHTSFLKDVAPLPGRDIRFSVRFGF